MDLIRDIYEVLTGAFQNQYIDMFGTNLPYEPLRTVIEDHMYTVSLSDTRPIEDPIQSLFWFLNPSGLEIRLNTGTPVLFSIYKVKEEEYQFYMIKTATLDFSVQGPGISRSPLSISILHLFSKYESGFPLDRDMILAFDDEGVLRKVDFHDHHFKDRYKRVQSSYNRFISHLDRYLIERYVPGARIWLGDILHSLDSSGMEVYFSENVDYSTRSFSYLLPTSIRFPEGKPLKGYAGFEIRLAHA